MEPFSSEDTLGPQAPDFRLLQNGPIVLYLKPDVLEEDVEALAGVGYVVRRFDAATWVTPGEVHSQLKSRLGFPAYYGANYDALDDSLEDIEVPAPGGLAVVIEQFDRWEGPADVLLGAFATAARYWLLQGRKLVVLLRVEHPRYQDVAPPHIGATPALWNPREFSDRSRSR